MNPDTTLLIALLLVAHYLGDYTPLSTPRMLDAKVGKGPLWLIGAHAAVHAALVTTAVLIVRPSAEAALTAAAVQLVTHFLIDFVKMRVTVSYASLQDPSQGAFWSVFGADQLAHMFVLLGIAVLVL